MKALKYFFEVSLSTLIRVRKSWYFIEEHGIFIPKRCTCESVCFACLLFLHFSQWTGLGRKLNFVS